MTFAGIIQSSIEIIAAALLVLGFVFEKRLISFERRLALRLKYLIRRLRRSKPVHPHRPERTCQYRNIRKSKNAA